MTIVMEEEVFSSSFKSSDQSPQSNYQQQQHQQEQQQLDAICFQNGNENVNTSMGNNDLSTSSMQQQNSTLMNTSNDNIMSLSSSATSSTSSLADSPNNMVNGHGTDMSHENGGADDNGVAFALLLCRPSNNGVEMFEQRRIELDTPCKIGRSVAKIKPESNNAIFDCKVLSRNHALLWYENAKFYIQDTKSSNGTFLNGTRLGRSNEESAPYELSSGDIIQFGVDVTENTKKVTHGCITVEIRLYHRNGIECKPSSNQQVDKVDIQTQELYQLALFLQEAMMREQVLHQKINSLQAFIDQAKVTSENGWLTLIDEDRLLSRIDFLEKQTILNTKNFNEENLRLMINTIRDEKFNVESTAKLTIQKMIEEKNELKQKYDELESLFTVKNDQFEQIQHINEDLKRDLIELASKNQELTAEIDEVKQSISELKTKYQEEQEQNEISKNHFETRVNEMEQNKNVLNAQIESLIAEKDFQSKRADIILAKYESLSASKAATSSTNENVINGDASPKRENDEEKSVKQIDEIKQEEKEDDMVNKSTSSETESSVPMQNGKKEEDDEFERVPLNKSTDESKQQAKVNILAEVTDHLLNRENNCNTNFTENNLNNSTCNEENDENQLSNAKSNHVTNHSKSPLSSSLSPTSMATEQVILESVGTSPNENLISSKNTSQLNSKRNSSFSNSPTNSPSLSTETVNTKKYIEELETLKARLQDETTKNVKLMEENKTLRNSVSSSTSSIEIQTQSNLIDPNQHNKLQNELRENLNKLTFIETELAQKNKLIDLLTKNENNSNKVSLSQPTSPVSVHTAESIKANLKLNSSNNSTTSSNEEKFNYPNEYLTLKDECLQLKTRLQKIETEMKKFLNTKFLNIENREAQLVVRTEDCEYLEKSYEILQELKEKLEDKESRIELNLTDAQKEADQNREKLIQVQLKLIKLEETCNSYKQQLANANKMVAELNGEFDGLSLRTKIVSYISTVPLFVLILAIMIAFYPILATITATGL